MTIEYPKFTPTHRHYKGGLYQELHRATHTETEERLVIYRDSSGRIWARPAEMFDGRTNDGTRRFSPIGEKVGNDASKPSQ